MDATLVARAARAVAASEMPQEALGAVLDAVVEALGASGAALLSIQQERLVPVHARGMLVSERPLAQPVTAGEGAYPLLLAGRVEGALLVQEVPSERLSAAEGMLAPLLDLAAIALRNGRLEAERRQAQNAALEALVAADQQRQQLLRSVRDLEQAVADRKHAEAAARRLADEKQALLDNARDMIIVWNDARQLTYVNRRFVELLGYTREEVLGRQTWTLLRPEDVHLARARGERRMVGKNVSLSGTYRMCTKDGRVLHVESSVSHQRNRGRIVGGQAIIRDITERVQAEQALRERETHFRALIEQSYDAIAVVDGEGRVRYVSPSMMRISGYGPDERVGQSGFATVHPEDLPSVGDFFAQVLDAPTEPLTHIHQIQHKSGTWRTVEVAATNRLADPAVGGVVLNVRDVTERQAVLAREQALREVGRALAEHLSEDEALALAVRHAANLLESPYTRVWFLEANGELVCAAAEGFITEWGAKERLAPRSVAGLVARGDLLNLEDAPSHYAWADPTFAGRTGLRPYIGTPLVRADRRLGVLEVMREPGRPFSENDEQLLLALADLVAIALDHARLFQAVQQEVAERARALHALGERVKELTALHAIARLLQDLSTPLPHVLQAIAGLLPPAWQYPEVTEARLAFEQLVATTPGYAASPWVQRADFSTSDGRRGSVEVVYLAERPSETEGPFLMEERQLLDSLAEMLAAYIERGAAEEQRSYLARTEQLRALGQMASGIAHDLNQSLALAAGYAELAQQDLERMPSYSTTVQEALQVIARAALDGGETVKRLLTFSRAHPEGRPERVDIALLLRETAQLTAPRWRDQAQAEGRHISLHVEAEDDMLVDGYPSSLREALTNLVFNAVDALPSGGGIVLRAQAQGDTMVIEVHDTGSGMSPEVQARIFEPFFTTKGEEGTGLGLAQVFGIVEQQQGRVTVSCPPGQGTTFRLELPAVPASAVSNDAEFPPAGDRPRSTLALRILAVDDEPALARLAQRMLSQEGHTVCLAHTGEEALNLLEAKAFDVVVSDLGLGDGMNGWELAEQVRTRWPGTHMVLATGWGARIDPIHARTRGVDAVVAKPYRVDDLRRALPTHLASASSAPAIGAAPGGAERPLDEQGLRRE